MAGFPLLVGAGTFLYGLMFQKSDFDVFGRERQARRIAILRIGIAFVALGVGLSVAYLAVWAWAVHR